MDFILTALPRSGTTWASVWLMDDALCLHDPLTTMTPADLLLHNPGRRWGISCTGIWLYPDFVEQCKCPVVLLDRNIDAICNSMLRVGFAPITMDYVQRFDRLPWLRFDSQDMFDDEDVAQEIWETLRPDKPFDAPRWRLLREVRIEPDFSSFKINPAQVRKLAREAAGRASQ
jgi:hypothetical protein